MSEVQLNPIESSRPLERAEPLSVAWQAIAQKLARAELQVEALIGHPSSQSGGQMWESADGRLMVIEAIRETDLSFQLADQLLRVKSLLKHSQLTALQLTEEVEGLCGQLDQAVATLHRIKDRPAAKTRGTEGGLATNAESRAIKDWAEAHIASGKVPVKFKGATAIAHWLLTQSPDDIKKTCPICNTLEDPQRVIRDEILRKRKAACLNK